MSRVDEAFAALRAAYGLFDPNEIRPGPCQWCLSRVDRLGQNTCVRCNGTGRVPAPSITNKPWLLDDAL